MSRPATIILRSARSINLRSIHTSIPTLYSELPPTPNSAEALGFKNQTNRQRQLPTDLKIKIPASGKKDIIHGGQLERIPRGVNKKSNRITLNPEPTTTKPTKDGEVSEENSNDFFSQSELSSSSTAPPSSSSIKPNSKSKSNPRKDIKDVSMDIINESSSTSSLPPDVIRRQKRENRQSNNGNNQRQGGQSQRQGQKSRGGPGGRKSRDNIGINVNSREKRVLLPKRQLTLDVLDHSEKGLFGKKALLISSNGGENVISHLGHARKTTSTRQTSSTPQFPSSPIPILSTIPAKSAEQAIQIASWTAALNGSIAPRVKSKLSETVKAQLGR